MRKWIGSVALGTGLMLSAPIALAQHQQQQQRDEVTMDQLPQAVRQTVQREVGNGQVEEIEREQEQGRTIYEVEFTQNNRKFELDIGEDGQVLQRHAD